MIFNVSVALFLCVNGIFLLYTSRNRLDFDKRSRRFGGAICLLFSIFLLIKTFLS